MPAIILDRDGVINYDSEEYIKNPDEWLPIPGSLEAIAALNKAGYTVYVATNQSGVARGLYDLDMLQSIHERFQQELTKVGGQVADIIFCPHHPDDNCLCRKPKAGMLEQIQHKHGINLKDIYFIGDSYVDVQAAMSVGCHPILVLTGKGQSSLVNQPHLLQNVLQFPDLASAVSYILAKKNHD